MENKKTTLVDEIKDFAVFVEKHAKKLAKVAVATAFMACTDGEIESTVGDLEDDINKDCPTTVGDLEDDINKDCPTMNELFAAHFDVTVHRSPRDPYYDAGRYDFGDDNIAFTTQNERGQKYRIPLYNGDTAFINANLSGLYKCHAAMYWTLADAEENGNYRYGIKINQGLAQWCRDSIQAEHDKRYEDWINDVDSTYIPKPGEYQKIGEFNRRIPIVTARAYANCDSIKYWNEQEDWARISQHRRETFAGVYSGYSIDGIRPQNNVPLKLIRQEKRGDGFDTLRVVMNNPYVNYPAPCGDHYTDKPAKKITFEDRTCNGYLNLID